MTAGRYCPTNHRHVEEDGVMLVPIRGARSVGEREMFVLGTCRDCGQRLQQRWLMRHGGRWGPKSADVAQDREAS